MSKYIIDVGDAYTEYICGKGDMLCLPVRINEFEDNWLNTNIPLTPYTEPDTEKVREEAYLKGLNDGQGVIFESTQNNVFNNGYKKCLEDMDQVRKETYQQGLSDAWEAARKICLPEPDGGISTDEICNIFNVSYYSTALKVCSASEAIEKIRAYEQEKEQEEIKVGDEVIAKFSGIKYVIVKIEGSRLIGFSVERATCDIDAQFVEKTGRHFPEIATAVAKMKETE